MRRMTRQGGFTLIELVVVITSRQARGKPLLSVISALFG